MNYFEYSGIVTEVQTRQGKNREFYLTTIDDGYGNKVTFCLFEKVGKDQEIILKGNLIDRNGYINVKISTILKANDGEIPGQSKDDQDFQEKGETEVFDDNLPF